ncbi:hypothetical protein GCK72_019172 [Caenorhabditis remanei]|uniref:Uncharacterized protein n=2 Tax=Caenorhabditis remanei TaxID=31234 RepID=A0A6A5GBK1_CAERE|nr:hypothetical protein GCK72_019172 [Caenorhabditis remanei]KAF1752617.1 hypothetical protein GCK72_019172 [Caenorhabditis remanei]
MLTTSTIELANTYLRKGLGASAPPPPSMSTLPYDRHDTGSPENERKHKVSKGRSVRSSMIEVLLKKSVPSPV